MDSGSYPRIIYASDHSLLVEFGNVISEEIHAQVVRFSRSMFAANASGILNIHPAYASVLISFDPRSASPSMLMELAESKLRETGPGEELSPRTVEIPVCYGNEFGPDLSDAAAYHNMTPEDVIRYHSSARYIVYFLGFTPGFPYLGGMPKNIAIPRRAIPRLQVPAGSVGIAGDQTGVYPAASPGGWRLIGRTPLRLFRVDRDPPVLLRIDDRVKFVPISPADFASFHSLEYGQV